MPINPQADKVYVINNKPVPVALNAQDDGGNNVELSTTSEGHLEVEIHGPRLPFGSVHTESLTPIFQSDAVYGLNSGQCLATTSGSGTATAVNSAFVVTTGTTIYSQGVIQSHKRLRYRAGQGFVGRFAGYFTTPVANSYQLAGFGHAEDGVYFGYREIASGTPAFGILYTNRGTREVRTLTVSVGASSASNATITLDGTATVVALTAASNIQRTVWELSVATYAGWNAYPNGATVLFVAAATGAKAGAFTFGAGTTGASASFATTKTGVSETQTWIPQSTWNGDKLDGTGSSGVTIDPTKGNVYQIGLQYLGFGAFDFKIEAAASGNNPTFITVHTVRLPNTLTATSFGNPSFPFTMAAYSAGSTTDLAVRVGSFAGFIEGAKVLHGNRFSYFNSSTAVDASSYRCLFTILNGRYYGSRTNQSVINMLSVSGALKHTSPCVFYLFKNATLVGNPNFSSYSTLSSSLWDTAATTCTIANNEQLLWTGHLGDTGEIDHHFSNGTYNAEELTIQPGEWITLACRSITGTPAYVTGSINTREDQ